MEALRQRIEAAFEARVDAKACGLLHHRQRAA